MNITRTLERRNKPRVKVNFPLKLRGLSLAGEKFEEKGYLDNISASGLYFWTEQLLHPGDEVHLTIQLSNPGSGENFQSNCLATLGKVVRVEFAPLDSPTESYGVAVEFNHYRFI